MSANRQLIVTKIQNVLPYLYQDGDSSASFIDDETYGEFTGIECTIINENNEHEDIVLLLPRNGVAGLQPCKGTYLLADAIRED